MISINYSNETKENLEDTYIEIIERAIDGTVKVMEMNKDYEVSVSLVDGKSIKKLNKEYRGVDKVTDVLSFPLDFETDIDLPLIMLGDVVINLEKIKEQAVEYGHSELRELSYLTVHSMLHLIGYDHIEEDDQKEMRLKEKEIMKVLGISKWKEIITKISF